MPCRRRRLTDVTLAFSDCMKNVVSFNTMHLEKNNEIHIFVFFIFYLFNFDLLFLLFLEMFNVLISG